MKISSFGLKNLMALEGVRNEVYRDSAGIPTIGVGHVLTQSERSSGKIYLDNGDVLDYRGGVTHADVMNLLLDDLVRFEAVIADNVKVDLDQNQFDALVIFSFNIGVGAFEKSTLLKILNKGLYEQAGERLKEWNKATVNGRKIVLKGLVNRRAAEFAIWKGQNPAANLDHEQPRPDEYNIDETGEAVPALERTNAVQAHQVQTALVAMGEVTRQPHPDLADFADYKAWQELQATSKPTGQSKIILSAGAMIASALTARYGLDIPQEFVADVLTWVTVGGASLIAYFRKYRTDKAVLR